VRETSTTSFVTPFQPVGRQLDHDHMESGNYPARRQRRSFEYRTGAITGNFGYSGRSTGPIPTYLGDYLANNSRCDSVANRWGRIYSGAPYTTQTTTTLSVLRLDRLHLYQSDGQLLEPDTGPDAGAQNGPAFAKTRRLHKAAFKFYRARGVSFGTDFTNHARCAAENGRRNGDRQSPTLFSDTWRSERTRCKTIIVSRGESPAVLSGPTRARLRLLGGYVASADDVMSGIGQGIGDIGAGIGSLFEGAGYDEAAGYAKQNAGLAKTLARHPAPAGKAQSLSGDRGAESRCGIIRVGNERDIAKTCC
jgi:hypothetical protein